MDIPRHEIEKLEQGLREDAVAYLKKGHKHYERSEHLIDAGQKETNECGLEGGRANGCGDAARSLITRANCLRELLGRYKEDGDGRGKD